MVPNTFEALTLSGKLADWFRYDVGYLWTIKPRDSNDFISMSRQAGVPGDGDGMILSAFAFTPIKDLLLYAANYFVVNTYNTVFTKGEYTLPLTKDLSLQTGLQFTDQRNVGDARLGDFNTWNVGAGARLLWKGLQFGAATHFTGDGANIRADYGSWPGYLSLQVTDFDRAKEKAFGFGVKYNFGGTLLPFQIPGFSIHMLYAQGTIASTPRRARICPRLAKGTWTSSTTFPPSRGSRSAFATPTWVTGARSCRRTFASSSTTSWTCCERHNVATFDKTATDFVTAAVARYTGAIPCGPSLLTTWGTVIVWLIA